MRWLLEWIMVLIMRCAPAGRVNKLKEEEGFVVWMPVYFAAMQLLLINSVVNFITFHMYECRLLFVLQSILLTL